MLRYGPRRRPVVVLAREVLPLREIIVNDDELGRGDENERERNETASSALWENRTYGIESGSRLTRSDNRAVSHPLGEKYFFDIVVYAVKNTIKESPRFSSEASL